MSYLVNFLPYDQKENFLPRKLEYCNQINTLLGRDNYLRYFFLSIPKIHLSKVITGDEKDMRGFFQDAFFFIDYLNTRKRLPQVCLQHKNYFLYILIHCTNHLVHNYRKENDPNEIRAISKILQAITKYMAAEPDQNDLLFKLTACLKACYSFPIVQISGDSQFIEKLRSINNYAESNLSYKKAQDLLIPAANNYETSLYYFNEIQKILIEAAQEKMIIKKKKLSFTDSEFIKYAQRFNFDAFLTYINSLASTKIYQHVQLLPLVKSIFNLSEMLCNVAYLLFTDLLTCLEDFYFDSPEDASIDIKTLISEPILKYWMMIINKKNEFANSLLAKEHLPAHYFNNRKELDESNLEKCSLSLREIYLSKIENIEKFVAFNEELTQKKITKKLTAEHSPAVSTKEVVKVEEVVSPLIDKDIQTNNLSLEEAVELLNKKDYVNALQALIELEKNTKETSELIKIYLGKTEIYIARSTTTKNRKKAAKNADKWLQKALHLIAEYPDAIDEKEKAHALSLQSACLPRVSKESNTTAKKQAQKPNMFAADIDYIEKKLVLPETVDQFLNQLRSHDIEAYLTGEMLFSLLIADVGYVNSVRGIDIYVNATPQELQALFTTESHDSNEHSLTINTANICFRLTTRKHEEAIKTTANQFLSCYCLYYSKQEEKIYNPLKGYEHLIDKKLIFTLPLADLLQTPSMLLTLFRLMVDYNFTLSSSDHQQIKQHSAIEQSNLTLINKELTVLLANHKAISILAKYKFLEKNYALSPKAIFLLQALYSDTLSMPSNRYLIIWSALVYEPLERIFNACKTGLTDFSTETYFSECEQIFITFGIDSDYKRDLALLLFVHFAKIHHLGDLVFDMQFSYQHIYLANLLKNACKEADLRYQAHTSSKQLVKYGLFKESKINSALDSLKTVLLDHHYYLSIKIKGDGILIEALPQKSLAVEPEETFNLICDHVLLLIDVLKSINPHFSYAHNKNWLNLTYDTKATAKKIEFIFNNRLGQACQFPACEPNERVGLIDNCILRK